MARTKKPTRQPARETEPEDDRRMIGYGRISTAEQRLDLQRDALLRAGVTEDNLHFDKVSALNKNRPGLANALMDARRGDMFVVWKLDRLARSLPELIDLIGRFKAEGITFRSLTESIDTSTAVGELLFHILGTVAQFERELIRERTRAGMRSSADAGVRMGAPKKLTPAKLAEAKRLIIADPDHSIAAAAEKLGVSASGLRSHLKGGVAAILKSARKRKMR